MTLLQHIVAEIATPKMQQSVAYCIFSQRHNGAMDQDESNGGPNFLRAWREHRGLSQVDLAEKAETTHQVIGYLERGRTQLSAKWLRKLAPVLETTPGMLLDHHPEEMSADVIDIWTRIPERQRARAARVLRELTGTDD